MKIRLAQMRLAQMVVLFGVLSAGILCASPTLTLIPVGGALTGSPNQTIGWGYTIVNDTADWMLFNSSNFCNTGGDPNFADCVTPGTGPTSFGPVFGTYTDYIATSTIEVAPNSTIGPTPFSAGSPGAGVGQYLVNSGALAGSSDVGQLFIGYNIFTGDPLSGGAQDPSDPGNLELSAAASVTVVTAGVPEPGTFALLGCAIAFLAATRKKTYRA
jgi:hypothetical protein